MFRNKAGACGQQLPGLPPGSVLQGTPLSPLGGGWKDKAGGPSNALAGRRQVERALPEKTFQGANGAFFSLPSTSLPGFTKPPTNAHTASWRLTPGDKTAAKVSCDQAGRVACELCGLPSRGQRCEGPGGTAAGAQPRAARAPVFSRMSFLHPGIQTRRPHGASGASI